MPILHAIVLGIVQGLSEFLPISSSGHLELTRWLFGWDDLTPEVETAFDVAVHLGTLFGAIAYLRRDVIRYVTAGLAPVRGRPLDTEGVGRPDQDRPDLSIVGMPRVWNVTVSSAQFVLSLFDMRKR